MPTFEKIRISLAEAERTPLYGDQEGQRRTRTQFFIDAFSERRDFLPSRGKAKLSFFPIDAPEGFVAGFFAREVHQKGRKGPEDAFRETDLESWEIAFFVMDLAKDQQIAWLELNGDFPTTKSILESFFKHLSRNSSFGEWLVHVKYMDSDGHYWTAINEYKHAITRLTFTFIPPNALNARQTVADFVKLANEQGHPDIQEHTYKADAGQMEPESEILAASADIAMEGGGEAKVYAGRKKVYDSDDERTRMEVDEHEMPTPSNPTFVGRVISRLFGK
ncbi:hypothetical protein IDJ81_08475 [Tsuneonella flava]|uniref:Uncharacterized protein n=1 Tax=Tsuneonella flava TaxID=2055955 RepID=A0ABX7K8B9_9SPHN|nr:hypothetical protein [Tsuneonella flava]QSB43436.1 hypothetical protein IDJ81_08475 [Tsuneonella flava]